MPVICAALDRNQSVRLTATGSSMFPFIKSGDVVELEPLGFPPVAGDLVLARCGSASGGERYVLHRVIRVKGEEFYLRGDAQKDGEGPFAAGDILARAIRLYRRGRVRRLDQGLWRHLGLAWNRCAPLNLWLFQLASRLRSKRNYEAVRSDPDSCPAGEDQPPVLATAKSYLLSFLRYTGSKAWIALLVIVLLGLSEGVGLIMLIPFLNLIGFSGAENADGISLVVRDLFRLTGLPLTLPGVLCVYIAILSVHTVAGRLLAGLNARMMLGYTRYMQNRLYTAFSRVDWLCFTRTSGAEVIRVVTSDLIRAGFATRQLLELIAAIMLTAIYLGVALSVSTVMTVFAAACATVIFLILQPLNRQAHSLGEEFQTAVDDMYRVASEHLGGMKIAKSYSLEDEHAHNFSEVTDRVAARGIRFIQVAEDTKMYHQLGAVAALSAFFFLASKTITIPPAGLLLVVFVFARLSPKVSGIQHHLQHIGNTLPAFQAADLMLSRFEAAAEPPGASMLRPLRLESAIRFRRVSFSYNSSRDNLALSRIDLVVPAHKTIALVGPSGSGKTTLADLLLGLLRPLEGAIFIDERPLSGEWVRHWRSSIGYVPQDTFLFHDTVRGNLLWARKEATEEELWAALKLAAAQDFVSALPGGLDTAVGDRGIRLSGGERQRLALARALLRRPTLLLLDEATSSLDTENEQRIQDAIEGLHGELTMVVIAHRLSTIKRADNIVVLDRGRVVETGPWELLARKEGGRFRRLLEQQK